MRCIKCGRPMRWEAVTPVRKPDDLRRGYARAPIDWAWHCRCGMWDYIHDEDGMLWEWVI